MSIRRISPEIFRSSRVLVIGDVALDRFIYGGVERISPEAPVPVLKVLSAKASLGCAGNVAANVAALGARVSLIGVVGADQDANDLQAMSPTAGHVFAFTAIGDPNRITTLKTRYISGDQQILRTDREDTRAIEPATEHRVLEAYAAALPKHDVVILSVFLSWSIPSAQVLPIIAVPRC
jgi:D-beta-D-heptose 7-phosphate kinase/D-beta-D-heptose 1-phosphate adenosyltransferase